MYEPFSQKAIRLRDGKEFYIYSSDSKNVEITQEKRENCIYYVRWNKKIKGKKIEYLWNISTHEIMNVETKEVFGNFQKDNKKWRLNINN